MSATKDGYSRSVHATLEIILAKLSQRNGNEHSEKVPKLQHQDHATQGPGRVQFLFQFVMVALLC